MSYSAIGALQRYEVTTWTGKLCARLTEVLRDLSRDRSEEGAERTAAGSDIVPVEADREETETFVAVRSAKDAGNPGAVTASEADDRDTGQGRSDELRSGAVQRISQLIVLCISRGWKSTHLGHELPAEDRDENNPEEAESLALRADVLVTVECVEKVDGGDQVGVDDVGREDGERAHQTGETVTEELRGQQGEDGDAVVGRDVVVQVVGGKDRDGLGCSGAGKSRHCRRLRARTGNSPDEVAVDDMIRMATCSLSVNSHGFRNAQTLPREAFGRTADHARPRMKAMT